MNIIFELLVATCTCIVVKLTIDGFYKLYKRIKDVEEIENLIEARVIEMCKFDNRVQRLERYVDQLLDMIDPNKSDSGCKVSVALLKVYLELAEHKGYIRGAKDAGNAKSFSEQFKQKE